MSSIGVGLVGGITVGTVPAAPATPATPVVPPIGTQVTVPDTSSTPGVGPPYGKQVGVVSGIVYASDGKTPVAVSITFPSLNFTATLMGASIALMASS